MRNVAESATALGELRSRSVATASLATSVSTCVSSSTTSAVALFATGSARKVADVATETTTFSMGSATMSLMLVMLSDADALPAGIVMAPLRPTKSEPALALPLVV